jgi:hypothetical protein
MVFPYAGLRPIQPARSPLWIYPTAIYSLLQHSVTSASADSSVFHEVSVTDLEASNNIRAARFFTASELEDKLMNIHPSYAPYFAYAS